MNIRRRKHCSRVYCADSSSLIKATIIESGLSTFDVFNFLFDCLTVNDYHTFSNVMNAKNIFKYNYCVFCPFMVSIVNLYTMPSRVYE